MSDTGERHRGGPESPSNFVPIVYADILIERMIEQGTTIRMVAERSGLNRSRVGLLLHRNADARACPTLVEFHALIAALDLSIFEVIIRAEAIDPEHGHVPEYETAIAMLAKLFRDLPRGLLLALGTVDSLDGTEIRPEWSMALERAVVKRVVQELHAVAARRAALVDLSF